jgi:hypothetical protein
MIESAPRPIEITPPVLPDMTRVTATLSRNVAAALAAVDHVFDDYPERLLRAPAESRTVDA